MELAFRIILFIVGVINFIPSMLAFFPARIASAYGISVPNVDYELLLRHRAVMLGIVGGLLLYAAFSKNYYGLVTVIGLISMVSFLVLFYGSNGMINEPLTKVMKIDAVAIALLLIGYLSFKLNQ